MLAAPISGHLDSPEGGFDAIMQAISCKVRHVMSRLGKKVPHKGDVLVDLNLCAEMSKDENTTSESKSGVKFGEKKL